MKGKRNAVLFTAAMLIGICVFVYPFAASWFNAVQQAGVTHSYAENLDRIDPEPLLTQAHRYNKEMLPISLGDPYSNNQEIADLDYYDMMTVPGTDVIAQVVIPTLSIDLPVFHGTSEEVLRKGAGHLYGTSLPVGGDGTHAAISAHTGMADGSYFDRLVDIKNGDLVYVTALGQTLAYQVTKTQVVTPEEGSVAIKRQAGIDQITLITCTPYGVNSHRLLVTAERVPLSSDQVLQDVGSGPGFPWWCIPFLLASTAALVFGVRQYRRAGTPKTPGKHRA